MATPLIEVRNIRKTFPGVVALADVSFQVMAGEVHALVGENGAGKSTLIKILLGAHAPTAGEILFDGQPVRFRSPFDASQLGIEGVHQELMLVPWLSVKQNIFLNREPRRNALGSFDLAAMERQSAALLREFSVDIDVNQPVTRFPPSIWKMIDIARVINLNPRVVIFDEPTAILTDREVTSLFARIMRLKEQGVAVIYISHRLEEIRKIASRVTVLRDGRKIDTCEVAAITDDDIVRMMVGRDVSSFYNRTVVPPGRELVKFDDVTLEKGQRHLNLAVHAGEVVGLAGLVGSGRTEIAEAMLGMNRIVSGRLTYQGRECRPRNPSQMIRRRVVLVPENRKYLGLILKFSVAANAVLSIIPKLGRFFYDRRAERRAADDMIAKLSIKTPSRDQAVANLSGGNQQKVVL
ncbi:MAG: sugar ABC transporter ATP-binding protein, partial [Planctomycetes bacterium]|nr:sugar ABC transporter ATP-binding protein [Planctomycetota bacterium]